MKTLPLITIAAGIYMYMYVALCLLEIVAGKGTAKGTFQYNKKQCKWYEVRPGPGSERKLFIQCGNNKDKSIWTTYKGDPHKCQKYLDGKVVEYYKCLVDNLITKNFNNQQPDECFCSKWKCGDVIFQKTLPGADVSFQKTSLGAAWLYDILRQCRGGEKEEDTLEYLEDILNMN